MAGKNPRLSQEDVEQFLDVYAETGSQPTVMTRYQELTRKLRTGTIDPDSFAGVAYVMSKITGEAGELSEQWGKAIRDDDLAERVNDSDGFIDQPVINFLDNNRIEKMTEEASDLLYYLSETCRFLGLSFEELAARSINKISDRDNRGTLQGEGSNR